jgi:hypothetical protein
MDDMAAKILEKKKKGGSTNSEKSPIREER